MHAYQITAIGLVVDIVGAFFLAAEAIKIENLRVLRDRVLARLRHATVSPPVSFHDDEVLTDERSRQFQEAFQFGPPWGAKHPYLFTLLHYIAGLVICVVGNWLVSGRLAKFLVEAASWILTSMPTVLAYIVVGFSAVWLIVAGLWLLGELVHVLLIRAIRYSIEVIEFIDRHTADGGVGIVGFSLLMIGFGLQLLGTVAAAP